MSASPSFVLKTWWQKHYIFVPVLILALGGFLVGFNVAVITGAVLFIRAQLNLTTFQVSLVVSASLLGAMLGSVISGSFTDHYGRKRILILIALLFIVSVLGSVLAASLTKLLIMRTAVGLAMGMICYITPLYISEISPHEQRGRLVTWNQLFTTMGIFCAYIANYFLAFSFNWRAMLFWGAVPAPLLLFGLFMLPESPRWLLMNYQEEKAKNVLMKLRASPYVLPEIQEIKDSLLMRHFGWRALFKAWLWPALLIGFGLAILQQITGIGVILYYAPIIFEYSGFHHAVSAILATLGIGAVNVFFTLLAMPLLDRWGRRPLLILGLSIMILGLGLIAAAFGFVKDIIFTDQVLTFIGMFFYVIGFAIGLGPIVWLILVEIFPLRLRGVAVSWATFLIWGTNFLVTFTALKLVQIFGATGTFLIYILFCVLGLLFVGYFMPETSGATLEQIESNLMLGKKARHLGD